MKEKSISNRVQVTNMHLQRHFFWQMPLANGAGYESERMNQCLQCHMK